MIHGISAQKNAAQLEAQLIAVKKALEGACLPSRCSNKLVQPILPRIYVPDAESELEIKNIIAKGRVGLLRICDVTLAQPVFIQREQNSSPRWMQKKHSWGVRYMLHLP